MSKSEKIDIPPEALEPKIFEERPGPEIVREIKEFIKNGGKAYLWWGHTHTKPSKGAAVEYLGEFDLPEEVPCPCCTPEHPKYKNGGKIGWFPDERVIRLIGPDCFKALNPEGHEKALKELRELQRRESDIHYLISNLPIVPQLIDAVANALPVAEAVDQFRADLRSRLDKTLNLSLWPHLRDGELRVTVKRPEVRRRADGTEYTVEVEDFQLYARLDGYRLLDTKVKRFKPRFETIINRLQTIQFGDPQSEVAEMSDDRRREAAKVLGLNIDRARRTFGELEEVRRFVSPVSVDTLRGWAGHAGSPIQLYAARRDRDFLIGKREQEKTRIEMAVAIDATLPSLPTLGEAMR